MRKWIRIKRLEEDYGPIKISSALTIWVFLGLNLPIFLKSSSITGLTIQ